MPREERTIGMGAARAGEQLGAAKRWLFLAPLLLILLAGSALAVGFLLTGP
jgi:hypothetical protein